MKRLLLLCFFFLYAHSAPLIDFPFPLLLCASTTTVTLGGTYTLTSTSTATSATTVTAPPVISVTSTRTTVYSPTTVTCLSTATTFTPYRAPSGTLAPRDPAPQIIPTVVPTLCPTLAPITIIPPTVSNQPCTCITGDFAVTCFPGFALPYKNPKPQYRWDPLLPTLVD
ncbi:hypothetical protein BJX99DRAFT_253243 [Aspergillus californicus]